MTTKYLLSGFGGQGILFAGKFLSYMALIEGRHLTWLPSYGPEMRGGTAACAVIVSDEPIGSPIVSAPDVLLAMNLPSLDKYERTVKQGGTVYIDSSLVSRKLERPDVAAFYVPATQLASDNGIPRLANVIMLGKILNAADKGLLEKAMEQVVSAKHGDMLAVNLKALGIGRDL